MGHALFKDGKQTSSPLAVPDKKAGEAGNNQLFNEVRDLRRNVEINVGKACNNRCVFCIDGLPKREERQYISWEDMQRELKFWYESGSRSVGFLGGEPTTYRYLPESVAFAKELGYTRIAIATNAVKLRKPEYTDLLVRNGMTRVTISMHGHTAELEEDLTRIPKVYAKKVAAIGHLLRHRRQGALADGVSVNIVINGWNYKVLPQMMKFFYRDLGLDDLRINFVRPEGYAEGDPDICVPFKRVVPYLVKAIVLSERHFKRETFTFGGFPLCALPPTLRNNEYLLKKYMGEYRDLSTDCSVKQDGKGFGIEEIADGRARFNWQDRKRFDLKHAPSACATCKKVNLCEGVWAGYVDIHGDEEFFAI